MKDSYHLDTSRISSSGIKLIREAPSKYYHQYLTEDVKEKRTESLVVGSAFHMIVTETDKFNDNFVIMPKFDGYGSRSDREKWINDHSLYEYITLENYEMICGMRDSVMNHPKAGRLFIGGIAEKEFHWADKFTGAPCKCKPDYISPTGYVPDLKSCEDASDRGFAKQILKWKYYLQDPFYSDGLEANNVDFKEFLFVAVEKTPPYLVNIHCLSESYREYGRDVYREELKRYMDCKESGIWPGYSDDINIVEMPDFLTY